ncbi:MAG: MFS transporter [Gemmatimonadales bacterium]
MYNVQDSSALVAGHRALLRPRAAGLRVPRTVVLLGFTSLLTDISSEAVAAVLPLYLVYAAGFSPLALGFIDGLYRGAAAITALASGFWADRRKRHKEVATLGYGLSAVTKLGLVAAGGAVAPIAVFVMLDRIGKGIRTAPRDALISLSSTKAALGLSFGVHRAMDTFGALLGPLAAFLLLAEMPNGFDSIFMVSFCLGTIGVGILVLFVRNPRRPAEIEEAPRVARPSMRAAFALFRLPRFRAIAIAGGVLGFVTISDAFVYLVAQHRSDLEPKWFPLLFLGTALTYLVLAIPFGRLGDRIGRGKVFVGGHLCLLALYAILRFAALDTVAVLAALALLGAYYAATDGVLMALSSTTVPEVLRTSGLGLISSVTALCRFGSSIVFGALWTVWNPDAAVLVFMLGLAVALPLAALVLKRHPEPA